MLKAKVNICAILRGEQRSQRFRYRHSVAAAAREIGIPTGWVWFWLHTDRLKHHSWLRRIWVRLEDVQELFRELRAIQDAFYATGEALLSPEAIQEALGRWPRLPKEMWHPESSRQRPEHAHIAASMARTA